MKYSSCLLSLLMILMLSMSSCLKEDKMLSKPDMKGLQVEIPMESDYKYQVFYSAKEGEIVKKVLKTDWDLKLSSGKAHYIWLNSSRSMKAAGTGKTNLSEVTTYNGLLFRFDNSSGNTDSNAIGHWWNNEIPLTSKKEVFVIDLGYDLSGQSLGYKKLKVVECNEQNITIEFANMDGSDYHQIMVSKEFEYNFSYISLVNGITLKIEPEKNEWNLLFSQYSTFLYDRANQNYIPYLVVGVLINPYNTEVAKDTNNRFEAIGFPLDGFTFFKNWDVIGYDWKDPGNVQGGGAVNYTVDPKKSYVLHTLDGEYYKMRFLDFINTSGQKGYPIFEQSKL